MSLNRSGNHFAPLVVMRAIPVLFFACFLLPVSSHSQARLEDLLYPSPNFEGAPPLSFKSYQTNERLQSAGINRLMIPDRKPGGYIFMLMKNFDDSYKNREKLESLINALVRVLSVAKSEKIDYFLKERTLEDIKALISSQFDIDIRIQSSHVGELSLREFLDDFATHLTPDELTNLNKHIKRFLPVVRPLSLKCSTVFLK